jgi:hypothetical protein
MCNCYNHKCSNKKCDEQIPVHIGDFCTDPENLEVFCPRHLPKRFKDFDGAIWKTTSEESATGGHKISKGYRIGIRIKDIKEVDAWCRNHDSEYYGDNYWKQIIHPNLINYKMIKDWS